MPELGDQPVQDEYIEKMKTMAQVLDLILNDGTKGPARKNGFVLLVFPFGDDPKGRCNYLSNGVRREDIINLFTEQIERIKKSLEK